MNQAGLHLAVRALELQQVLGLAQGAALDQLEHVLQLRLTDVDRRPLSGVGDRG